MYGTCETTRPSALPDNFMRHHYEAPGYGTASPQLHHAKSYSPSPSSGSMTPSQQQLRLFAPPLRYEVQEGDTLRSIARKVRTSEDRIRALNPMVFGSSRGSKGKLYAGQQLVVDEANTVSLPPPPEVIDNGWGQMHLVRPGETLRDIALLYNTTEETIRNDNRNYFPAGERGIMFSGQLLHIRIINTLDEEEPIPEHLLNGRFTTHVVAMDDTFESICKRYKLAYNQLLQLNRIKFPVGVKASLQVGDELIVPDPNAAKFDENLRNVAEIKLTKQIHVVDDGETPEEIAARYHMTYEELREYNRAYFPKGYRGEIQPGYKLVVKRLEQDNQEQEYEQQRSHRHHHRRRLHKPYNPEEETYGEYRDLDEDQPEDSNSDSSSYSESERERGSSSEEEELDNEIV